MSYYREQLETWLKGIDIKADRVGDIGGGALPIKNRVRSFEAKEYVVIDNGMEEMKVDDFIRADINFGATEELKKQVKQFDVIFCLEVFEYVYDPVKALDLIYSFLKKGGVAYISFPFVYPQHQPVDIDYLRYTPNGAIKLLQVAGFEKIYSTNRNDKTGTLEQFYRADGMHPSKNKDNSITGLLVKAFK